MIMKKIGMFEAKTHLPEIIKLVQSGEDICLTNRQKEVAFLISVNHYYKDKSSSIFSKLKDLKKRAPLGTLEEIISAKDEGRK